MTCIVALRNNETKTVTMGADNVCITHGTYLHSLTSSKIFVKTVSNNEFLIGVTGPIRLVNLIEHKFDIPCYVEKTDLSIDRYFVNSFIPRLMECFKSEGFSKVENNENEFCGMLLIAFKGRILRVYNDFSFVEFNENFGCCGSGEVHATSALSVLSNRDGLTDQEKLEVALETAEKYCNTVRGPFNFLTQKF